MSDRRLIPLLFITAAISIFVLTWCGQRPAGAKPARHPVTEFAGDRYAPQMAQGVSSRDVTEAVKRKRGARPRPGKRQRVPVPRPRPGDVTPLIHGGVVGPLAAKAREIASACGSRIISAIRFTRIAGTGGRLSLHASGRAVDIAGNPACIYSHLRGWPGGVSVDYGRVKHVHVSYAPGGHEWGLRFNHYRGGKRRARR